MSNTPCSAPFADPPRRGGDPSTRVALANVSECFEAAGRDERVGLVAAERVELVDLAMRVVRQAEALRAVLIAEAEAANASMMARGTSLSSHLSVKGPVTGREASGLVYAAQDVARHQRTRDAALAGEVTVRQARAIAEVLGELPATLDEAQRVRAEEILLQKAAHLSAERLGQQARAVLAVVAPEVDAAEDEQSRLEVRARRAHHARNLWFTADGRGSVLIKGSLPEAAAAPLVKLVDAYVASDRAHERAADQEADRGAAGPGGAATRTPEQRRADALLALVAEHARAGGRGAGLAGDRPRIVVTMSEEALRTRTEQAGLLDSGARISAGELRRLCCDAELTPAVLGSSSQVLDVGRTQRLVTPDLRRALSIRDAGCVFPGCQAADAHCEAHHIVPWWAGGRTSLANLVLLCKHHHGTVEPLRFWTGPPADRWQVRIAGDGIPEFTPPSRADVTRTPLRHERFTGGEACAG